MFKHIEGHDSDIHIFPDRVLKVHGAGYFEFLQENNLHGESYWLEYFSDVLGVENPHVVNKLGGYDGGIWMERLAAPLGTAQGVSASTTERLVKAGITPDDVQFRVRKTIEVLRQYNVRHRDIHPGNVLWDGEYNFKLIDFTNATDRAGDADIRGLNPRFGQADLAAVDKIRADYDSYKTIRKFAAQLGVKEMPGSTTSVGMPYHPIPLPSCDDLKSCTDEETEWTWQRIWSKFPKDPRHWIWGAKVVDIGCSTGFYSFKVAKRAGEVLGIDADGASTNLASALAEYHQIDNASFRCDKLTPTYFYDNPQRWNLAFVLNVHHWIHKEYGKQGAQEFLHHLAKSCERMFFMTATRTAKAKYVVPELGGSKNVQAYLNRCGWKAKLIGRDEIRTRYLFECLSRETKKEL